jgi:endo-1,4-beta-xylanase
MTSEKCHACRRPVTAAAIAAVFTALGAMAEAQTPESYRKLWKEPAVVQRIERNIEQHRMGDATIKVVGADGQAAKDASVDVRQQTHEFLFGCNAFVLGQLKTDDENRRYEEAFLRLFNFATIPFYWEATEPTQGELRYQEGSRDIWRRPPPDRFLPWAAKNGVTLKGHPLLWHSHNPSWLPKDADALKELYRKRFREIAARYGEKVAIWEVVNESQVCLKAFPLYSPDRAYVKWAFAEAAPLFPKSCRLMINEVTEYNFKPAEQNAYLAQVKSLLAEGARVQGIGLQYHFFRRSALDAFLKRPKNDPAKLLDLYEQFGKLAVPLYITEITIPSAGPGGEELQAEVIRNHYRLWFSAPSMAGITWWNLGDGTAVYGENEAKGGLLDEALRPKAAYRVLEELIRHEWMTSLKAETNAKGLAIFRGFYGKYRVKLVRGDQSRTLEIDHARSGAKSYRLTFQD